MENGLSSTQLDNTGSTALQEEELYDFLIDSNTSPQWVKEQLNILNKIRYIEEKKSYSRINGSFNFPKCNICGQFTSYLGVEHNCYRERCETCGQWVGRNHTCENRIQCENCGQWIGRRIHTCEVHSQCKNCGQWIGRNNHICKAHTQCEYCGQWIGREKHVCGNTFQCRLCGEFYSEDFTHTCKSRWGFHCSRCGVFTGSKQAHVCSAMLIYGDI